MKYFQSKIKFAQIETKVGEDDHWLGTATESWGEVAFIIFYNQDIFGKSPFLWQIFVVEDTFGD